MYSRTLKYVLVNKLCDIINYFIMKIIQIAGRNFIYSNQQKEEINTSFSTAIGITVITDYIACLK